MRQCYVKALITGRSLIRGVDVEKSDQEIRGLLSEWWTIKNDPFHPINNRRHPKHDAAMAALRLLEEEGRRLLGEQACDLRSEESAERG